MKILSVLFSKKTNIQYFLHLCFFISYFLTPSDIIEPFFDKESQAVLEVSQGKSQVFIYDPLSVARHNEKYKETTRTIMTPLENVSGWGIAMRKNQPELKAKVDAFITKAKTDGTFDKIREKYLKEKKEEVEKTTGMKFFF